MSGKSMIELAEEASEVGTRKQITVADIRTMMAEMAKRRRERLAQCAAEGHVWKDWVALPPDRAGRACGRCSEIEMVQFVDEDAS